MLRFIVSEDAGQAKGYYTEGLTREDYYSQGQEIAGEWYGKGAERLNLKGQIAKEDFNALCDNRHPFTEKPLTPRTKSNRRVGYDINFHCPKSVSVLYGLTRDQSIMTAFTDAVRQTMREMEIEMETRVRVGGKFENRRTGNMVWAEFVHLTARPVKGMPDPHLHCHCFVFNASYDSDEQRWKAGEFGNLKANAPYFEAVFHARLARQLRSLGYDIDRTAKGWEVAGIPKSVIEKFSRRTAQIEELADKKGIVSARDKDRLGAATRENKRKGITLSDLRSHWDKSLTENERAAIGAIAARRRHCRERSMDREVSASMDYGLNHAFERKSAVSKKRLLEVALRRGVGMASVDGIKGAYQDNVTAGTVIERDIGDQEFVTTKDVLWEEHEMLVHARDGRGMCRALTKPNYQFESVRLTGEQKAAVQHVLSSQDRIILLRGRAGVGKTTLMKEAVAAIEQNGRKVFTFAPSAEASRGILRQEGFKNAETVASLLLHEDLQEAVKGQVIWIDEAGLLGARTMKKIFELADKQKARVILAGDTRQHTSVERGDALRLLEQRAGLASAEVKTIHRQRGSYRDAIASLSEGKAAEGFRKLNALGVIREGDSDARCAMLVRDYMKAIDARRSVLVIAPTHAEGDKLTHLIRQGLKDKGVLQSAEERTVLIQENLSWTEAQRADKSAYELGQVIQFQQNIKTFKKGERLSIIEENGETKACNESGDILPLPVQHAKHFQVYEEKPIRIAAGDNIRFTSNGTSLNQRHRVHNGSLHRIKAFTTDGNLLLENGWEVSRDYGHLTHGYVSTSYAAQGKTVDRVFISQGAESLNAANQEQFYVSTSRGRESVAIYTDSKEELFRAIDRSSVRLSATELLEAGKHKEVAVTHKKIQKHALFMTRLMTSARMWAERQVGITKQTPLPKPLPVLQPIQQSRPTPSPPIPTASPIPDILRRYGRVAPPPPSTDLTKDMKHRGRERDR